LSTTVITGAGGFLGTKLARRLANGARTGGRLVLVDRPEVDLTALAGHPDVEVRHVAGDVTDPGVLGQVITPDVDCVYHLASVVSAGAEADFDLGYSVNLQGTIALLERCRAVTAERATPIKVVFTSSLATYGSGGGQAVDDRTAQRPETSYGVHKATCELLLNDYTRKGFVDGRGLRLPTVTVRPGAPNLAASGFASGIIREPLAGVDTTCPVTPETVMAVISPRRVIDALVAVAAIDGRRLGSDRTVLLPGLAMQVAEAVATARAEGERAGLTVGTVRYEPDPAVQAIVDTWPPVIRSERAASLGFDGDTSVAAIVRQHLEDEVINKSPESLRPTN
jgi:nucleoside-diphosphate-sugar epimerase